MHLYLNFMKIQLVVFEILRSQDLFFKNCQKSLYQINNFEFRKKTINILEILFLYVLNMLDAKLGTEVTGNTDQSIPASPSSCPAINILK